MKPNKVVWVAIGIVTVGSLSIASLGWTKPGNNRSDHRFQPGQTGIVQQRKGGVPDRNRAGGLMINWTKLDLSEEQKEQMQQTLREFQLGTAEIRQKLQFAQQDVRNEMRRDPIDQAKIDNLWANITTLKQQLGEASTNRLLAIKSFLTPEQLEELQERGETAQELRDLRAEYRELLLAPGETDSEQLQKLQAKITEKEIALEKERSDKLAQRWAELTPEQHENIQKWQGNRGRAKVPRR